MHMPVPVRTIFTSRYPRHSDRESMIQGQKIKIKGERMGYKCHGTPLSGVTLLTSKYQRQRGRERKTEGKKEKP
jgi:hypothetical protein